MRLSYSLLALGLIASACADVGADPDAGAPAVTAAARNGYPDLDASISGPAAAAAGSVASYTIRTTNRGVANANSVTLTAPVPAGASAQGLSSGCSLLSSPARVRCATNRLRPGQSLTKSFSLVLPASGPVTVTVTAATSSNEPNTGDNYASVVTQIVGADLVTTLAGPATADGGTAESYTLNVTNRGAAGAADVWITIPVPANTSAAAPGTSCYLHSAPWRLDCAAGTLDPGETFTAHVILSLPYTATAFDLEASATTSSFEANLGDNDASVSTVVSAVTPVAVAMAIPQDLDLVDCFGEVYSFAACVPSSQLSGTITLLPGGVVDTGSPSYGGVWSQSGPDDLLVTITDPYNTPLTDFEGIGVSSSCFEGLIYPAGGTQVQGAFQACVP